MSFSDVDSVSQDSIPESVEENGVASSTDRITTLESFDESAQHETSSFNEMAPAATAEAVVAEAAEAEAVVTSLEEPAPTAAITSTNGDKPLQENGAKEV